MANDSLGQPLLPTAGQPGGPIEQCAEIDGQASPSALGFDSNGTYFTNRAAFELERQAAAQAAAENIVDVQARRPKVGEPNYTGE